MNDDLMYAFRFEEPEFTSSDMVIREEPEFLPKLSLDEVATKFEVQLPVGMELREGVWHVILNKTGLMKIHVLKIVRDSTGLSLKEAKRLVDSTPQLVLRTSSTEAARLIVDQLKAANASAYAMYGQKEQGILYK